MPRLQEKSADKSPERKLVTFFEKSRNKWKAKARDSKRVMKQLKNRICF